MGPSNTRAWSCREGVACQKGADAEKGTERSTEKDG